MKVCSRCKINKDVNKYAIKSSVANGRGAACKECMNNGFPSIRPKYDPKATSRACKICKVVKDLKDYHSDKNQRDGRVKICKACVSIYQRDNKKTHGPYAAFIQKRSRSRREGVPFNLTLDFYNNIPDLCPVLGIPLIKPGPGKPGYNPNRATIDKLVPSLGYILSNCEWISLHANLIKTSATTEEVGKVYKWMLRKGI
jgi:hypothetical protein